MIKICKYHGETDYALESRGYYRCKKCRSGAVADRRRKIKKALLKIHGSKCVRCGYDKCIGALHFHHPDTNKEFQLSSGNTHSLKRAIVEASKCILLCANCHAEEHYD